MLEHVSNGYGVTYHLLSGGSMVREKARSVHSGRSGSIDVPFWDFDSPTFHRQKRNLGIHSGRSAALPSVSAALWRLCGVYDRLSGQSYLQMLRRAESVAG